MAQKQMMDFGFDSNDDLAIANGDFLITECTQQYQRQLLLNDKGQYKQNPTICVGVYGYMDDDNGLKNLARDAAKEYARDGMTVISSQILPNGTLQILAYYPQ